jgi:outer membrane protein insertion porin family
MSDFRHTRFYVSLFLGVATLGLPAVVFAQDSGGYFSSRIEDDHYTNPAMKKKNVPAAVASPVDSKPIPAPPAIVPQAKPDLTPKAKQVTKIMPEPKKIRSSAPTPTPTPAPAVSSIPAAPAVPIASTPVVTEPLSVKENPATVTEKPLDIALPDTTSADKKVNKKTDAPLLDFIDIIGNKRIEDATILSYMDIQTGDQLTPEVMDRTLKKLFATGLFADVVVRRRGQMLEVDVKENPLINRIVFEGNKKLKEEELFDEISLRPREVLTRTKVQSDVERLYQIYRKNGRFSAAIEPKIIELDQNRVNLVYEIDEGALTKVRTVRFVGNDRYDEKALADVLTTKESRWYKFISSDNRYDPDRLAYDEELLRRFYLMNGYVDFRVISANAELSPDRKDFYVTFTIEEGQRYKVGEITIDSALKDFDANILGDNITLTEKDWYNAESVQTTIDSMVKELGDHQYAFVTVTPDIKRNPKTQIVDIIFNVSEAPKTYVERINIKGNVRTEDRVIRRRFDLSEGDPFNRTKLSKSEQKIKDLGYFEKVKVETNPGSAPDKTVVDVEVAEQSTGELSVGAGFSTVDGPLADFRIKENNFLGKGQQLAFGAVVAGIRTQVDASFTEPYFLGRDLTTGFDLFHVTRNFQDQSSFDQQRSGGAVRFGYPLSQKWRQNFSYKLETNDITNVSNNASRFIREQAGQQITSSITQRLTFENRDSTLFPTEGYNAWFDTEAAGLGGDANFVSAKLGASYYYPVTKKVIFNLMGESGAIEAYGDDTVQINNRYFLGVNTFRGFDLSGIGPRDLLTGDALGGNRFYRGTAEFSYPIGLPESYGVRGHTFTDFGSLWGLDSSSNSTTNQGIADENALRASAGLGVSWKSPLGPIRLDYSVPYLSKEYDVEQAFQFNFGTRF